MKTRTKLMSVAAAVLMVGIATYAVTASSEEGPRPMRHGMGGTMDRMGPGMMGMAHDRATMAQMQDIHRLLASHDRIRRTVTNLPDGIRTVTESDDPEIAQLIKRHVAEMGKRVAAGDDPNLPMESAALHSIFRNREKINTKVETTEKGAVVTQTSNDADAVAALQEHASQVTDLVRGGIAAAHTAMMRNGGAMHGSMMGQRMMQEGGRMRGPMGGGMMHGPN